MYPEPEIIRSGGTHFLRKTEAKTGWNAVAVFAFRDNKENEEWAKNQ
jgi:hypothetical protein